MTRSAFAIAAVLAACGTPSTDPDHDVVDPATDLQEVASENAALAVKLYRQASSEPGNLFMSPHSISMGLGMTYAGANGTTATQIADAMGFTLPDDRLHTTLHALDLALRERTVPRHDDAPIQFRLQSANAMWGQHDYPFLTSFREIVEASYGGGIYATDFKTDPNAVRAVINGWVADRTEGRITELLGPDAVDMRTALVLTNAVRFSAAWNQPFEAERTTVRPFHTATGSVSVLMMTSPDYHADYATGDGWAAVDLPYEGHQLSMMIIVPTGDLTAFEATLSAQLLDAITSELAPYALDLTVPRFAFDAELPVRRVLEGLGIRDAFIPGVADFSGIDGTTLLYINCATHKAFVGVDELGTDAAAATAFGFVPVSLPPSATVVADRPFLFFIRDRPTGAILFMGRVVDPSSTSTAEN
ncbi:MAG: serpin family protein [Kofleriaceae bacterium]